MNFILYLEKWARINNNKYWEGNFYYLFIHITCQNNFLMHYVAPDHKQFKPN